MVGLLRFAAKAVITALGGKAKATLKRENSLLPTSQRLRGVAGAGASTLMADAPALSGKARAGSLFTIAGVAGTYEITVDAEASAGVVTLSFSPALQGSGLNDAVLSWVRPYGEFVYSSLEASQTEETARQVPSGTRVFHLVRENGKPAPEPGDFLNNLPVIEVSGTVHYRVVTGATP